MEYFESDIERIPNYELSDKEFLLSSKYGDCHPEEVRRELVEGIEKDNMAPYYLYLGKEKGLIPFEDEKYQRMKKVNEETVEEMNKKIKEAEDEDETELDPVNCSMQLAEYYARIGDRALAKEWYNKTFGLSLSTGTKIDLMLALVRVEFFFRDLRSVSKYLDLVKSLIDKGGDWERRNRYKTYYGVYLMATRNFTEASKLLIDSLATFTSTELCRYEDVACYSMICGVLALDRVDLKTMVIDSPEILSIYSTTPDIEPLMSLTNSLYTCQYNCFFQYLLEVHDKLILANKFLNQHASYFLRELRCKAYRQLLESYRSLSLKSMAASFNVTEDFLDEDLCKFIPTKKLNCTIDKVHGIIETNRPDNKNSQYNSLIKQGDALLVKLEKYGSAVKLSGAERVA